MPHWLQRLLDFLKRLFRPNTKGIAKPVAPPLPKPTTKPQLKLETDEAPDYRKRESLFTFQESKFFYKVLLKEFSGEYQIFAKVRLGDVVWLANEPADRKFHNNQIQCKHIDFVLCDRQSLEPILAIELDDSSHSKYDRRESDKLKDRVCEQAELPLLRLKVQQTYSSASIAEEIRNKIRDG